MSGRTNQHIWFLFLLVLAAGLIGTSRAQTPSPSPTPFPLSGPTSIFRTYDAETLRKGEFKFSVSYAAPDVREEKLASALMGRPMPFRVVLPASYSDPATSTTRFAVVYLLHGLTGHYNNWTDKTKLAALVGTGNVIVVTPEGEDGWYTDSASKPADKYESYVIKELIPEVDKKYRTLATRDHRAVAGLSMGGYGAVKFGLKYPSMFSVVGSFSGALGAASITEKEFPGAIGKTIAQIFGPVGSDSRRANDVFDIVRRATPDQIKKMPFIYFDCGTEDFLFQNNRDFVNLLVEKKVRHEFRQLPGAHNWEYWRAQIEEFLDLVARQFERSERQNYANDDSGTSVQGPELISPRPIPVAFRAELPQAQVTDVRDRTAARMLLGRHKLSLQWVSWDSFGVANVTNRKGVYSIQGAQTGRGQKNTDSLIILGSISSIDTKAFTFRGKIVTKVSHINGGDPCVREGEFTFKITGKRRYWRLQQMDSPCDTATDYVDIYFR